ncbi:unnamed protein product [Cladocopium goreaui]|uniref:Uncharacterized protein n=1 Tax=Cladocopium goreaui TaxID=2562237 RepID=A0A9P1G1M7_9DINO|nr:unnamed protein product [Cladocopium goreaui]
MSSGGVNSRPPGSAGRATKHYGSKDGEGRSKQSVFESQHALEQENRRLSKEIRTRNLDMERLQREAVSLREQIQEEQRRRRSRVSDLQEQLQRLEGQNRQLQAQLSRAQLQITSKVSDATALKREVVTKTMELEKLAREFQQSQSDLCSRVHSVSDSLLQMSRDVRDMTVEASRSEKISSPVANPSHHSGNGHAPGHAGHVGHSGHGHEAFAASTPAPSTQFASLGVDDETLHALKRRLQSLGDVLVFTSDKFDACCASGHSIPPGAVRVRPRRCDHVFLVECLMPYWVGGLCPVCRCSFAYSRENDESDRCSSVSTSVSQRANVLSLRHEARHLEKVDTREVMASLNFRGPKVLRGQRSHASDASGPGPSRSGTGATGVSGSLGRTSSGRDRPL